MKGGDLELLSEKIHHNSSYYHLFEHTSFDLVTQVTDQKMFVACSQWIFPVICQKLGRGLSEQEIAYLVGMERRQLRKWLTHYSVSDTACIHQSFSRSKFKRVANSLEEGCSVLVVASHKYPCTDRNRPRGCSPRLYYFDQSPHPYGRVGISMDEAGSDAIAGSDVLESLTTPTMELEKMIAGQRHMLLLKLDPLKYKDTMAEWLYAFATLANRLCHLKKAYDHVKDNVTSEAYRSAMGEALRFYLAYWHLAEAGNIPAELNDPLKASLFGEYSEAKIFLERYTPDDLGPLTVSKNDHRAAQVSQKARKELDELGKRLYTHMMIAQFLPLEASRDTVGRGEQTNRMYGNKLNIALK